MRPRNRLNRNLPPNLYSSKKGSKYYFRYRNPQTGKETGMGSDRQQAIRAAHELNGKLTPAQASLIARVIGGTHRMDGWLDRYKKLLGKRDLAAATMNSYTKLIKVIREGLGTVDLHRVDTRMVAGFLESYESTPTMARQLRSRLKDIFDEAIREGVIKDNPATVTRSPRVKVQRARLSLDEFQAILRQAEEQLDPWVANAMLMALLTGQRREDIANMQFSDVQENYLHVKQHKSGSLVRLSLDLHLDVVNMSISDVVSRCRDRVVSRHMIHRSRNHPKAKAGTRLKPDILTRGFHKAREKTDLTWSTPPSFHEIRSLSGRLHNDQGVDAQALLGHKDARTTSLYIDNRGSEWISVG